MPLGALDVQPGQAETVKIMDKKPRRLATAYALCYAAVIPALQEIAREHGYALAVHGSMATDLDLLACPWTDEASNPDLLIEALRECVNGDILPRAEGQPTQKPHGRLAWSINLPIGGPYLDVSVMPRYAS